MLGRDPAAPQAPLCLSPAQAVLKAIIFPHCYPRCARRPALGNWRDE